MPVSASQFLDSAEAMLHKESEINYRNAASRAYYSAFHYCGPISQELHPVNGSGSGMHREFIGGFVKNPSLKIKAIGYILRQCYDVRLIADYKLETEFTRQQAETSIKQVKDVFVKVDALK